MKIILLTLIAVLLSANNTIKLDTYYESFQVQNSKQKEDGYRVGFGGCYKDKGMHLKAIYEHTLTNTYQPPLQDNLNVDKLFLRADYRINHSWSTNAHYINVLHDNIVPTAHSASYGLGATYHLNHHLALNFTQFYTDFQVLDVYQSDLKLDLKMHFESLHVKLSSITKAIHLDGYKDTVYSKNADQDYLTTGLKIHSHYKSYHFGAGVYFGKRVFAVMQDGFKLQHHAMEFNETYAIGLGKSFSTLVLRLQYVYQRATELPMENENVTMDNFRFLGSYSF